MKNGFYFCVGYFIKFGENMFRSVCRRYLKRNRFPYRKYQDKNKCIFIHIPKTAGTSLLQSLGKKRAGGRDHISWLVYRKSDAQKFKRYFKFAFVRDPLDRTYSAYKYLLRGGNQSGDLMVAERIKQYPSFEAFVLEGLEKGHFRSHVMFRPQADFVVNGNDEIVVDFIGKFENIEEDFNYVKSKLGLKSDLAQANRSTDSNNEYLESLEKNKQVMSVITSIYAQDYLQFGYPLPL